MRPTTHRGDLRGTDVIIHPRESIVRDASLELESFVIQWLKKHELTYGEIFTLLGEMICRTAKYAVRAERHPDNPNNQDTP